jgi:hypothetical protein
MSVPFTETKAPEAPERLHRGELPVPPAVQRRPGGHAVLPVLGMAVIGVPFYYLCKPGQSDPYNWFPYVALGIAAVSVIYSIMLTRRDPGLGDRVGSIIADE